MRRLLRWMFERRMLRMAIALRQERSRARTVRRYFEAFARWDVMPRHTAYAPGSYVAPSEPKRDDDTPTIYGTTLDPLNPMSPFNPTTFL